MPSLRQLLSLHPVLLVVDACCPRLEVSVWRGPLAPGDVPAPAGLAVIEGEASVGLPRAVARALAAAGLRIQTVDAAAFCVGPGSVLGIRLAAASLRAWRAVRPELVCLGYHSLSLLAPSAPDATLIADARRDTWHVLPPGAVGAPERRPTAALADAGPLATPAEFRRWSALPPGAEVRALPYTPAALLSASPNTDWFFPAPEPDVHLAEAPAYATWTPRIHRAPGSA